MKRYVSTIFLILLLAIVSVNASLFAEKINSNDVRVIKHSYSAELVLSDGEEAVFGLLDIRTKPFYLPYNENEIYTFEEYLKNIKKTKWLPDLNPLDYATEDQLKAFYDTLVTEIKVEDYYRREISEEGPVSTHFYLKYKGNEYLANNVVIAYYCPDANADICEEPLKGADENAAIKKIEIKFAGKEIIMQLSFDMQGSIIEEQSSIENKKIAIKKEAGDISAENIIEPKMRILSETYQNKKFKEARKKLDEFSFAMQKREKEIENYRDGRRYDESLVTVIKTIKTVTPKSFSDDRKLPYIPSSLPKSIKTESISPAPVTDADQVIKKERSEGNDRE